MQWVWEVEVCCSVFQSVAVCVAVCIHILGSEDA